MIFFSVISRICLYIARPSIAASIFVSYFIFFPSYAYPESVFQKDIMARPAIPQPQDPFVLIFFSGGSDSEPHYGFVTDGHMSRSDWVTVLNHVGYLGPYSIFNLKDSRTWATYGQDVALRAAQAIRRATGGSVAGLPKDRHQWHVLRKAYNEALSLRMTHIFHDAEPDLGTPGGGGKYRIEFTPGALSSTLSTPPSKDLAIPPGNGKTSLAISFGACFDLYAFGGRTVVLSDRDDNNFTSQGKGWYIAFHNVGGSNGKNYISFYSDGTAHISSPPLSYNQARLWNDVRVSVEPAANPRLIKASVSVGGVGMATATLPKPTNGSDRLTLGNSEGEQRPVSYDNLVITTHRTTGDHIVARYSFEPTGHRPVGGLSVVQVPDVSGNGHDLRITAAVAANAWYVPTTGIDDSVYRTLQRAGVSELFAARRQHGFPPPLLLTNWRLNDRPGRFAAWKTAGFTNGSTEYYLPRNLPQNTDKISYILDNDSIRTRWAAADGSRWNHVWLGQVDNHKVTLTPDEYQTLVVMAVLDGNRWFSVFTEMSDGHLSPHNASRREKALTNADALYKMAQAASWYQSTSTGLRDSVYTSLQLREDTTNAPLVRARINRQTKEMWFAGYQSPDTGPDSGFVNIHLPVRKGTVINLATLAQFAITSGTYRLPLSSRAVPYYFHPLDEH